MTSDVALRSSSTSPQEKFILFFLIEEFDSISKRANELFFLDHDEDTLRSLLWGGGRKVAECNDIIQEAILVRCPLSNG